MPTPALREVDLLILSLLLKQPSHGYALLRQLTVERECAFSASQVYHSLHKLHRLGFLEKRSVSHPDRPTSNLFSVRKRSLVLRTLTSTARQVANQSAALHSRTAEMVRLQTILETVNLRLIRAFGSQFRTQ